MRKPYPFLIIVVLLLTQGLFSEEKKPVAKINFLKGKVEIQREGENQWTFAKPDDNLYNNDAVRTYGASYASLGYADESKVLVDQESKVSLNSYYRPGERFKSSFFTAFYGAVFFVIKEMLPKRYEHRVYTPTSVIAVRGTSFNVRVDKETGLTELKVLNGTVLLKNILNTSEKFINAGQQATVAVTKDPVKKDSISQPEISTIKTWISNIDQDLIKAELDKQVFRAQRDKAVLSGTLEDKIMMVRLVNLTNFTYKPWDIEASLGRLLSDAIKNVTPQPVIFLDNNQEDPAYLAKKEKAKTVISGEIENFEITKTAGVTAEGDQYREYFKAKITVTLYVVRTIDNSLIKKITLQNEAMGPDTPQNDLTLVKKYSLSLSEKGVRESILGNVLEGLLNTLKTSIPQYL
jgi:hypothetical protein